MKLHAGTHVVEKSGNFEESKFSIEASSKAFFILSDGLYSNKILAVVRELSTNAYDSHAEAGKADVPFDVHLPTAITPVFYIRDYGTGMSHEDCMQLYTTYFRSTRNNSNEAVGCLGLGSKAPFAYSDSFVVEAYLDGVCRTYNAHKDSNGNPTFSMMHEHPTNEPNGIKVSLNVNHYDINRFKMEAQKVYEYFKVKPKFRGESIDFNVPSKILSGENWYFDDNASGNLVIMGQIAYPLDGHQLSSSGSEMNKYRQFVDYSDGLRIFVKIGDVDITPSRESLSYSKETKQNLCNLIDKIANEITNKIEEEIKSQPTLYKARIKYVQISEQCSSIKSAIDSLQKSISWNDIKLFDNIVGESINVKGKISCNRISRTRWRKKIDTDYNVETLYFNHAQFIIDDLTRGGVSRIKQYMKEKDDGMSCYMYKLADGETVDSCKLLDIMGGASKEDVILTSTLPKVTYNRTHSSSGDGLPAIQIQLYNEESGRFEVCNMSVKYENAYYFVESKDNINIHGVDINCGNIEKMLTFIHDNYPDDIEDMTFYAVKPSVVKNRKLEGRDNWRKADDVLSNVLNKAIEDNKESIINYYKKVNLSASNSNIRWKEIISMTQTDNELKKIVSEYNEYMSSKEKIDSDVHVLQSIASHMPRVKSVDFSEVELNDDRFSKRFDKEMKKYPILNVTNAPWHQEHQKIFADYIDTITNSL